MPTRHPVEAMYRGQRHVGEWYVEGGLIHVTSLHGSTSGPVFRPGLHMTTPAEIAARMLWKQVRAKDPKRPFFYWA